MANINTRLIKTAAGLLHYSPSTDREDTPTIPNYYRRAVEKYHDKARRAAILMRDASDHISKLQAELDQIELEYYQDQLPDIHTLINEDIPF